MANSRSIEIGEPSMTHPLRALALRVEQSKGPDRELERLPKRIARRIEVDSRTGCWNWMAPNSLVGRGRGRVAINGKSMLHHRAIWALLRGDIPEGAWLCHHCDNPKCGNPEHLYIGDAKSNAADMSRRKRTWAHRNPELARRAGLRMGHMNTWARGSDNPKARLSPEQAAEIAASTEKTRFLAARFGVHRTTIQRVRGGMSWNS